MKKLRNIIIFIFIICIILVIGIVILNNKKETIYMDNNIKDENLDGENTDENGEKETDEIEEDKGKVEYSSNSEEYVTNLINKFSELATNDIDVLYEKLNNEYKENKFSNKAEFYEYANKYLEQWKNIELMNCEKYNGNEYVDYICIDKNNNYYVFRREKDNNDYSIMLDIYTLKLEWLENRYNLSTELRDKIDVFAKKIYNMIVCDDYNSLYSKLSENFRKEKFDSKEKLQEYLSTKIDKTADYEIFDEKEIDGKYVFDIAFKKEGEFFTLQMVINAKDTGNYIFAFSEEEGK